MQCAKRKRRSSHLKELVTKSREAALSAVQIFNSPLITFKSEIYVVLMHIAWIYLLHAYYRKHNVEYRYYRRSKKNRIFEKTKSGSHKHWGLESCLNSNDCPLDKEMKINLRFLIGLRHEIEHQMTTRIDSTFSAKFQACCLNYNECIKKFFGDKLGIDKHLAFSLQFTSISQEQIKTLPTSNKMPSHIKSFIEGFENQLTDSEFESQKYAYRVLFVPKLVNHKGQADEVIEFIKPDSPFAEKMNKTYVVIKNKEKPKYLPSYIVSAMQKKGYKKFNMYSHTDLWKNNDARKPSKGYGVKVARTWYWYEKWVKFVEEHCRNNAQRYGAV